MTPRGKKSLKHDNHAASMEKKNKRRNFSGSDDDEDGDEDSKSGWRLKAWGDIPAHSIYNTTSRSQPAELFRKDLISAMKLPDSEPLFNDDYWLLSDPWKQEWEKGVQVPVNPDAIPQGVVRVLRKKDKTKDYKLPVKLLRTTHDEFFSNDFHQMSNAPALADKMCRYDLDNTDVQWLKIFNMERDSVGLPPVQESVMETVIEEIEVECYDNMQEAIQTQAGLGIEYDEDVICDVCRSPDSEEGNEMVFCDACDICVHQACYGIQTIPEGSWLCKTCAIGIKPSCILCPNKGGAMKTTKSNQKWAHVSCALWIPEVSIGCVDKMEPIVKISQIPASRWALVCCLCRDRSGACIQCSVKTCKTAYHVTCAFKNGLHMKAIIEDQKEDDLKLRSYCPKHTKNRDKKSGDSTDSESGVEEKKEKKTKKKRTKPKHEMNSEEKANARDEKIKEIEANFQDYVTVKDVVECLQVDSEIVDFILQYWKLKRTAAFGRPLIPPKSDENDILGREKSDNLYAKMRMFVHLRQDLERVRNLCYMVNRREKLNAAWFRLREEMFHKQLSALTEPDFISDKDRDKIVHAHHGNSIYDKLYSYDVAFCDEKETEKIVDDVTLNGGVTVKKPEKQPNPYAKTYVNGRSQRRRPIEATSSDILVRSKKNVKKKSVGDDVETNDNVVLRNAEDEKRNDDDLKSDEKVSTKSTNERRRFKRTSASSTTSSCDDESVERRKRRRRKKKDGRELARQESVKIRQSMFRIDDPLRGYKIPKVTSRAPCDNDEEMPISSAMCNGNSSPCTTPPRVSGDDIVDDNNSRSPRLIIKLKKDPNYPESPRWKRDDEAVSSDASPSGSDKNRIKNKYAMRLRTSAAPAQQDVSCKVKKFDAS